MIIAAVFITIITMLGIFVLYSMVAQHHRWFPFEDNTINFKLKLAEASLRGVMVRNENLEKELSKFKKEVGMETTKLFKRGDKVKCVDSKNEGGNVVYGKEYVVSQNQKTSEDLATVFTGSREWEINPNKLELLSEQTAEQNKMFNIGQEVFFVKSQCNKVLQKDIVGLESRTEFHLTVDQYKGICISSDTDNVCVKVPVLDSFDLIIVPIKNCFRTTKDCDEFIDKMVIV